MSIDTAEDAVDTHRRRVHSVWGELHVVTVVLVRDDRDTLPEVLSALAAQTRRPDRVVVVDQSGSDGAADGGAQVALAVPVGWQVLRLARDVPVTDAVRAALDAADVELDLFTGRPADTPADVPADARASWIWLLTGDSLPEPDALQRLLTTVEKAPSVAVAGCKQVEWHDRERLRDVGLSLTWLGGVVTGLDRGELDQGQHDVRNDVLAVRLPGMLVRRDAWLALGGPDRELGGVRADVDLCRRARLRGYRVVVVPAASVATAAQPVPRVERRDALTLRLAWTPLPLLPFALLWSVLAGLGRALTWLVLKQPGRGLDELLALVEVLGRPLRWLRVRRRVRAGRTVPVRALRPLAPGLRPLLRQRRDELAAWVRPAAERRPAGRSSAGAGRGRARARHRTISAVVALAPVLLGALAAGLSAGRQLLTGDGAVVSAFLAPMPERAGDLWRLATGSWRPLGLGSAAPGDPLAGLLSLASWPVGGDGGRLVAVLLLGGPALAAASAAGAAAALLRGRTVQLWSALIWGTAPALMGATLTGRPGAVLVHLLLPWLVVALVRSLAWGSVTAAAGAGLVLTAVLAGAPALAVPVAAMIAVLGMLAVLAPWTAAGRSGAGRSVGWRRLPLAVFIATVPAVLLLPWWLAVLRRPALLAADPAAASLAQGGAALSGSVPDSLPGSVPGSWWRLAAVPESPGEVFGVPPALLDRLADVAGRVLGAHGRSAVELLDGPRAAEVLAVVLLAPVAAFAVVGLFRRPAATLVAVGGWLVALVGLAAALAGERIVAGAGVTTVWSGPALSLMTAGLLTAAVIGAPVLTRRVRRVPLRWRWTVVAPVGLCLVIGPLAALAALGAQGARPLTADGPRRAPADVLPAVSTAEARGPLGARTLVLSVGEPDRPTRWALYRDAGPRFGTDSTARRLTAPDDAAIVLPLVAALLSDSGQDQRTALADLAVGTVVLLPPVDEAAEQSLDSAVGLVRANTGEERAVWRVDPPPDAVPGSRPSRVRVVEADGAVSAVLASHGPAEPAGVRGDVAAGSTDRRLVLAERADPGWWASLDGAPLQPVTVSGWAQGFELPQRAGRLEVGHRPEHPWTAQSWFTGAWLAVAVLVAVLALPLPRVRERIRTPLAPTPTRPVYRSPATQDVDLRSAPKVFDVDHPEQGELPPMLADDDLPDEPVEYQAEQTDQNGDQADDVADDVADDQVVDHSDDQSETQERQP